MYRLSLSLVNICNVFESQLSRGGIGSQLNDWTPPHVCACFKPWSIISTSNVVVALCTMSWCKTSLLVLMILEELLTITVLHSLYIKWLSVRVTNIKYRLCTLNSYASPIYYFYVPSKYYKFIFFNHLWIYNKTIVVFMSFIHSVSIIVAII